MKPEITVTIKFHDVTIGGLTVRELRELRDMLNELVGDRAIERREFVPYWFTPQIWTVNTNDAGTRRSEIRITSVTCTTEGSRLLSQGV
jgi:hypothetical protein